MFVQVIQGRVADGAQLHEAYERWLRELAPGADGWLGTTAGVTADGEAIALARFESATAAQRNSRRPEQHQWWTETARLYEGEVAFHDCTDVVMYLAGGSDDAGFVQVMQGEVRDPVRARQLMGQMEGLREFRPEIIGGTDALHGDGRHFTGAAYFTSEAAAREGERKEPPPELRPAFAEEKEVYGEISYFDLTDPWLYSPRR